MPERSTPVKPVKPDKAIRVRRRLADMRLAEEMKDRGWTCLPPEDEIQQYVREKMETAA